MSETFYLTALASVNADQVVRNGRIDRGTPGDPGSLIRVAEQFAENIALYEDSLSALSPPTGLANKHRAMVIATTKLGENARIIVERLRTTGINEDFIPLVRDRGSLISAFVLACHNLNPTGFVCGSLIEGGSVAVP